MNARQRHAAVAAILAAAGLATAQSNFEWTGLTNNEWNVSNNWFNLDTVSVNGFPQITDTANFTVSAAVNGGQVLNINVGPAATLTLGINGNSETQVAGTITNNALITFPADDTNNSGFNVDRRIQTPTSATTTLTGGGEVALNGIETGFQGEGPANSTLHNLNNEITGYGTILSLTFINDADLNISNGPLQLQNTILENTNGIILIDANAELSLDNNSEIFGGTLDGAENAAIPSESLSNGGILRDLQIQGHFTLGAGPRSTTRIAGSIFNGATLTFVEDSVNSSSFNIDQRLRVQDLVPATLDGNGELILNGIETGIQGDSTADASLTNENGHTIRGNGSLQTITITNRGRINPENGTLELRATNIENLPGGQLQIAAGATLDIDNNSSITGGEIIGEPAIPGDPPMPDTPAASITGSSSPGAILDKTTLQGTLTLGSGSAASTTVRGNITNQADITFINDEINNSTFNIDQRLLIEADTTTTIDGNGSITLNGFETGFQGGDAATSILVINDIQHTIKGNGSFQALTINNNAIIQPSEGEIELRATTINNDPSALIDIQPDARLRLDAASSINQGEIQGQPGAAIIAINNAALTGPATLQGELTLGDPDSSINTSLTASGIIENDADITFVFDEVNNSTFNQDQRIRILENTTLELQGVGSVNLNGVETGFEGDDPSTSILLHGSNHSINGVGVIEAVTLTNDGTIAPTNGTITLDGTTVTQTPGGAFDIRADSTLNLSEDSSIAGGTISGQTGAILSGGTGAGAAIEDLTITGTLNIGDGVRSSNALRGEILNSADIVFFADNTNNATFAVDNRFFVETTATLSGPGSVQLNGSETGIEGSGRNNATLNHQGNHTIQGTGTIEDITLINRANINPSDNANPVGAINLNGANLELEPQSTLVIDIDTDANDQLTGNAAVTLGGTLQVNLLPGVNPVVSDRYLIITADAFTGAFDTVNFPMPPNVADAVFRLVYTPTTVEIVLTCFADLDGDTIVGLSDLLIILGNFGEPAPLGPAEGDLDDNGLTDLNDLLTILSNFGEDCTL